LEAFIFGVFAVVADVWEWNSDGVAVEEHFSVIVGGVWAPFERSEVWASRAFS
jgi:hypothetical protein